MTLVLKTGDLFTSTADALGHGVNCMGLMGAGIAVAFKERCDPAMYEEYRKLCEQKLLKPGLIYPFRNSDGRYVINIASQEYPGPDATYEWLDSGMANALAYCSQRGLKSLAVPRIGCGIGGLEWDTVRDLMQQCANSYADVDLEVWSL